MPFSADLSLFVGLSVLFSLAGAYAVRRKFGKHNFAQNHEVASYFLSIVSSLYAILLGLVIFNFQNRFEQAKVMAETEVNSISDLYQLSRGFPPEPRHKIRMAIQGYYHAVQDEDWEAIATGNAKEASVHHYAQLWKAITEYKPKDDAESACFSQSLAVMTQFSDARRPRTLASKHVISPLLWSVLIIGAVLTVIFTYFFWVEHAFTQYALTAMVAVFLSLNLMLIRSYENPYRKWHMLKENTFNYKRDVFGDPGYHANATTSDTTKTEGTPDAKDSSQPDPDATKD